MFGLFKPPIETRLFPLIWPQPNDNAIEMCRADGGLTCPTAAIQATTATANLAIANHYLLQKLPADKAETVSAEMERLVFECIARHDSPCRVSNILRLGDEREEWRRATGLDAGTLSNLKTVMQAVYRMRTREYRADMAKAMETALSGKFHGYGPMGYMAKRWLSQLFGRTILRDEDLLEDGFTELGVASLYFTYKVKEMAAAAEG